MIFVEFPPITPYHPSWHEKCIGMEIIITDKSSYNSVETGVKFLYITQIMKAWEFSVKPKSMNKLWGNNNLTRLLKGQNQLKKVLNEIKNDEALFREQRKPYLLYD